MYNSTYGAGYRAGMAEPVFKRQPDGAMVIKPPKCPFPLWRIISNTFWHSGYHDGVTKRINQVIIRRA